jgi:hypothetical protein
VVSLLPGGAASAGELGAVVTEQAPGARPDQEGGARSERAVRASLQRLRQLDLVAPRGTGRGARWELTAPAKDLLTGRPAVAAVGMANSGGSEDPIKLLIDVGFLVTTDQLWLIGG